ncbi:MAG: wax ester/triacylglycerol synthase domain-containing protein [Jiangellaceae bacterium]
MATTDSAARVDESTSPAPRGPYAEFMQIWEEGYVSNHISARVMQLPGLFITDGNGLRLPDGSLDRAKIRKYIVATMGSHATFRVRLQRSFLGLSSPAWVPDEKFDIDRHIIFADRAVDFATADLRALSGDEDPVFSLKHPLWRVRITPLTDGRVAIGIMIHHASTDGLSGMKLFSSISQGGPDEEIPAPTDPFAGRRAAKAWELPFLALSQWWARQGSVGAAWKSYWTKPLLRRIRRVAARITLPLRFGRGGAAALRAALPPRHSAYRITDAALVGRRARELGGTLSDLQVSAMIGAWPGEERVVSLRFPVSFHSASEPHIRNNVRDMEVYGDADADLAATMTLVHRQVVERDDSKPPVSVPGFKIGYSTLLPWVSRPRYFCGAEMLEVAPFPASLGGDSLAVAGIMYRGKLFVGGNMPASLDVEATIGRVYELMSGQPDPGRS